MRKIEIILYLGTVLMICGFIIPQIIPTTFYVFIGLFFIYIGLFVLNIFIIYSSYIGAKEAKKGKGYGIIEILIGEFLLVFSSFLIAVSIPLSSKFPDKAAGFIICNGIYILLVGLFLVGTFRILSFFYQRDYKKRSEAVWGLRRGYKR